jgi:hypothetical protein
MSAIYPLSIHRRIDRQWADRRKSVEARIVIATAENSQRAPRGATLKSIETIATRELAAKTSVRGLTPNQRVLEAIDCAYPGADR